MTANPDMYAPAHTAKSRRSLLGFAAWGGMALVGTVAGVFGAAGPAQADAQGSPCCTLAKKTVCGGSYCNRSCPSGYTKRYWWCNSPSGQLVGCGECIQGSTSCHGDEGEYNPIACSWWWYVYNCEN